ncbi:hypothetical cytosolic protein [Syntrophus aciditrophicus SB]|uniref:Hypothetical cytosolic protein n=1 Tax=Syntrophus aciditrophicus (strain SB) TaxID=56780 RepID=Q2LPY0_SYNAS|nr:hypothetical cytosolic protein [Syntrophus aciditrophicus SB]
MSTAKIFCRLSPFHTKAGTRRTGFDRGSPSYPRTGCRRVGIQPPAGKFRGFPRAGCRRDANQIEKLVTSAPSRSGCRRRNLPVTVFAPGGIYSSPATLRLRSEDSRA